MMRSVDDVPIIFVSWTTSSAPLMILMLMLSLLLQDSTSFQLNNPITTTTTTTTRPFFVISGGNNRFQYQKQQISTHQKTPSLVVLFMVSKKQKLRLQEGRQRLQVYEEAELLKKRNELISKLNNINKDDSSGSTTTTAKMAMKLLKNAKHDGLNDFGIDVKLNVMNIFYNSNRPTDIVSPILLQDNSDSEDEDEDNEISDHQRLDEYRLWAYSTLKEYQKGLPYAERLYYYDNHHHHDVDENNSNKDDDAVVKSSSFTTTTSIIDPIILKNMAIQIFANTDTHLSKAEEMLFELIKRMIIIIVDNNNNNNNKNNNNIKKEKQQQENNHQSSSSFLSNIISSSINSLLQSYIRIGKLDNAKSFFQKVLNIQKKQQEEEKEKQQKQKQKQEEIHHQQEESKTDCCEEEEEESSSSSTKNNNNNITTMEATTSLGRAFGSFLSENDDVKEVKSADFFGDSIDEVDKELFALGIAFGSFLSEDDVKEGKIQFVLDYLLSEEDENEDDEDGEDDDDELFSTDGPLALQFSDLMDGLLEDLEDKAKRDEEDSRSNKIGNGKEEEEEDSVNSLTMMLLNKESYRLALECSAKLGDINLMEEALGDKEQFEACLSSAALSGTIKPLSEMMNSSSNKEVAISVLELVLETFINNIQQDEESDGVFASQEDQTLVRNAVQTLLAERRIQKNPKLLSDILVAFRQDDSGRPVSSPDVDKDLTAVVQSCIRYNKKEKNNNNNNKKGAKGKNKNKNNNAKWYASLSDPAKARILYPLTKLESKSGTLYTDTETLLASNSWNVLTSLFSVNSRKGYVKNVSFLNESKKYYPFCLAAFFLSMSSARMREKEGGMLVDEIIRKCWKTLLLNCITTNNENAVVPLIMDNSVLPQLNPETSRVQVYLEIVKNLQQQVMDMANSIFSVEDKLNIGEGYSSLSLKDQNLYSIVHETVWLLRSIASASSSFATDELTIQQQILKKLAIDISIGAMRVVGRLEKFNDKYYWYNCASDNGAKEALQTIMKELILSNLLTEDEDLYIPAYNYYYHLRGISASSSVISYKNLLFPLSIGKLTKSNDPYQDFRDAVLGTVNENRQTDISLESISPMTGKNDEGEDHDLSGLLPALIQMSKILDNQRPGEEHYNSLVRDYTAYFRFRGDLFSDPLLLNGLCSALVFALSIDDGLKKDSWFADLWTQDVANEMIQRLATCEDGLDTVQYYVKRRDFFGIMREVSFYLVGLYVQAGIFEASSKLEEEYLNACTINCRCLIDYVASDEAMKLLPAEYKERGGRLKKRQTHFAGTVNSLLSYIARHWQEKAENMRPELVRVYFEILIDHVLDSLWDVAPPGIRDGEYVRLFLSNLEFVERIKFLESPVQKWCDKYVKEHGE